MLRPEQIRRARVGRRAEPAPLRGSVFLGVLPSHHTRIGGDSMRLPSMLLLATSFAGVHAGGSSWTRWGGPTGDFRVSGPELVEAWPESGPRRLWAVELGDGYSAVLCRDDRLYTVYSEDKQEIVVALDRKDGSRVW